MSWVLALSLLYFLLIAVAWCGVHVERLFLWKAFAGGAGLLAGMQALEGLSVMVEPWRLPTWELDWLAVAAALILCGRGLLWKRWI